MATPSRELHQGSARIQSVELAGKSEWTIGRSLESDLVLNHSSVSRRHARVFLEDGAFYVDDLGSTHGTMIAGQR